MISRTIESASGPITPEAVQEQHDIAMTTEPTVLVDLGDGNMVEDVPTPPDLAIVPDEADSEDTSDEV